MKHRIILITTMLLTAAMPILAAVQDAAEDIAEEPSFHQLLKEKFIEGNAFFMSLVALALIIGLTFCIERIIYLTLAGVNSKKLLKRIEQHMQQGNAEAAIELCRNTRGPVASICMQAIMHRNDTPEDLERSITAFADTQLSTLAKGCSWIKLFISLAPSLGFLGTVIGMVMAFENIEVQGDISPTIVAEGMKVALITTIFGIIVAVILQVFYNFILSKIDHLTAEMEAVSIDIQELLRNKS